MNAEKMSVGIRRAIEMTQKLHGDMVADFIMGNADSVSRVLAIKTISGLSVLEWYLESIIEGVAE